MKKYCVIDLHYGDFIEAFDFITEARIFVNGLVRKATEREQLYNLGIGKYIDDITDNYRIVESYKNN